jgi:hypothetical protein
LGSIDRADTIGRIGMAITALKRRDMLSPANRPSYLHRAMVTDLLICVTVLHKIEESRPASRYRSTFVRMGRGGFCERK